MLNLREYKNNPDRLSDLLPWAALVAPGVILNKDGSFQATISYRGPDLDSSTESELISISARVNNVLKRLGSGWVIYSEALRSSSKEYPESIFPDPISNLIDEERRIRFETDTHFESNYYLTLIYLPPRDSVNKITSTFIESKDCRGVNYSNILESFISDVEQLASMLGSVFSEVEILDDEGVLSYLHSCVSEKAHKIKAPECGMYLDSVLSDSSLVTGFEPKLEESFIKAVSVKGFPGASQPGLLDRLNRLSIPYRWVTRFICLDKAEAEYEINKYKKRWFAKRKGIVTLLKETILNSESVMSDSDAVNKSHDADEALQELLSDGVSFGYFTATIVLIGADREEVYGNALEVERIINSLGFASKLEDVNCVDAWLGTVPGNCRNNVRRPIVHTLNLSHLMPISAVWAGPLENQQLKGPALLYGKTGGSTQFRLVTHVGDVGHCLILGPTGAGKSVLLNLMEAQFLKYKGAQVYIFEKGGSSRAITAGVGGEFYDLGAKGNLLTFAPLSAIDELSERRWALDWLTQILTQEKVLVTPAIKEELWKALGSLSSAPKEQRSIFGLTVLLQNVELRQALIPFTHEGAYGEILDCGSNNLKLSNWQSFEMEVLMETPSVVMPVLTYLFHRLESRFTGAPTLLVLDEAWLFLDNPNFSGKIREWLKVLRKANVSVIFATQSLTDIDQSLIAATLKEACLTKIYLPNASALNDDTKAMYQRFGLNERQIRILYEATPKKDYYYTSPLGNRLFELGLGEVAAAYCGATSKEQQRVVKEILGKSKSVEEFNRRYLEELGLSY